VPIDLSFNRDHTRAAVVFSESPGNVLTIDLIGQMRLVIADLGDEPHLKLVTIEGAGDDFSFGASIAEHVPEAIGEALTAAHALLVDLIDLPVPTAAVVRGRCLGGGFELALACDFILAAPDASFGLPEIALGVFPPAASVLLPLRVGAAHATQAVLTGTPQSAVQWERAGLVQVLNESVDDWYARRFARRSAEALRYATRAIRFSLRETLRRELPVLEQLYLRDLMSSSDAIEGVRAFLQKRAPKWTDE
jgi:cyclohexa-1,5-dienecarbonyl-CoA hydratase